MSDKATFQHVVPGLPLIYLCTDVLTTVLIPEKYAVLLAPKCSARLVVCALLSPVRRQQVAAGDCARLRKFLFAAAHLVGSSGWLCHCVLRPPLTPPSHPELHLCWSPIHFPPPIIPPATLLTTLGP